jgi:hypothetical protein
MKLLRYLIVYGLLALLVGNGVRFIYLDQYYSRRSPRVPDPTRGMTYRLKGSVGIVYVTREQWLWYGSYDFAVWDGLGVIAVAVALHQLNQRWNVIKNPWKR